jgi:hypothetical protein
VLPLVGGTHLHSSSLFVCWLNIGLDNIDTLEDAEVCLVVWRLDGDGGLLEAVVEFGGDLCGVGGVAVEAEGLGREGEGCAVGGEDGAFVHDAEGLGGGFVGIAEEGVFEFAGAEGAVRFVAAIGESFGGDGESGGAEFFEHDRPGQTDEDDVGSPHANAFGDGVGNGAVAGGLIVKSAVGFDVPDWRVEFGGDCFQCEDLPMHHVGDGFGRKV